LNMQPHRGRPACQACEQALLRTDDLEAAAMDSSVAGHIAVCGECTELFEALKEVKPVLDRYQVAEASEELIETVLGRALLFRPVDLATERPPVDAGLFRVLLAGLVSLPLMILINGVMGWALYELAASVLPRTLALYCVGLFAVWASLAVSFGYASLPFLGALVGKPTGRLRIAGP
jgi:hypothetical protein